MNKFTFKFNRSQQNGIGHQLKSHQIYLISKRQIDTLISYIFFQRSYLTNLVHNFKLYNQILIIFTYMCQNILTMCLKQAKKSLPTLVRQTLLILSDRHFIYSYLVFTFSMQSANFVLFHTNCTCVRSQHAISVCTSNQFGFRLSYDLKHCD